MTLLYSKSKRKYHIYLFVLVAFLLQITLASIAPLAHADENLVAINKVTETDTKNEDLAASIEGSSGDEDISNGGTDSGNDGIDAEESGTGEEPEGGNGEIIGDPDDGEPDDDIGDGVEETDDGAEEEAEDEQDSEEDDVEEAEDEQDSEEGDVEEEAADEQDNEEDAVEEEPRPMIKSIQPLGGGAGKDLDDIFTVVGLWKGEIGDDGSIEDLEEIKENQPVELDGSTKITMKYDWDIKNRDVEPGDTASIKIPDIFVTAGSYPTQPLLLNNGITNVGTWTITEGILQLTFGGALGDGIDPDLLTDTFILFGFTLKMKEFEEDITYEIEFNDSLNKKFNLVIEPSSFAESIDKVGVPDGSGVDGKEDAREITWTIDVLNTEKTNLVGATLSETAIPDGLSLDINSFTQTPLTMGYNGISYPKGTAEGISDPSKNGGFEIQLPEIAPYSGYRIEYTTTITDFSITKFTNTANLSKGDGKSLTATATVGNLTRSAPLEKSGEAKGKDEIKWTIYVNKGGISIAKPIVKDTLPAGLAIKEIDGKKQITVYKYDSDDSDDPWEPVHEVDISDFPNGLELPKIGTDDIYKIEYITTIDYTQVNGGIYQKTNSFTNGAILLDGENPIGDPVGDTVNISRANLLSKSGEYPAKYGDTLTWTITVNSAYHKITNAKLYDTIPENLIFDGANVKIEKKGKSDVNWAELTGVQKPEVSDMDANRTVTIDLGDITEEYKITYTTQITGDGFEDGYKFENKAWLVGDKTGTGIGTSKENPVDKSLTPSNNSYGKKYTNIDYDNKIITWQITIDPIKEPITKLKIVDTFPNRGLVLLPDTLVIERDNETMASSAYILNPNIEEGVTGYQKGFILEFTDGTSENPILSGKKMTITYQTSYDPQGVTIDEETYKPDPYDGPIDRIYKNKAVITGETKSEKAIEKTVGANALTKKDTDEPSWLSGKKEGRRIYIDDNEEIKTDWISGKDRLIEWKIYINYLKQDLGSGVTVTDTIQYDGQIDLSSVEIRKYSVDPESGSTTDGELTTIDYDKDLSNGNKTLEITFNETVTERYVIIYRTTVPGKSEEIYTNKANVDANGKNYPYDASVSYGEYDQFIDKKALMEGDKVYTDDEIEWEIVINENLSTGMTGVIITDTIAPGMAFKSGSLEIYRIENETEVRVVEGENEKYKIQTTGDHNSGTTLTIEFNNTGSYKYTINHKHIVRYKTIITATSGPISNSAEITGSYVTKETISSKSYSAEKFGYTGGTVLLDRGKIRIEKVDEEGNIITNNPAEFKLYYKLNDDWFPFNDGEKFSTGKKGYIEIHSLPLREYQLKETEAPEGFKELENEIVFDVTKPFENDDDNVEPVSVENEKIKVEITGIKEWENGPTQGRPDITLQLFRSYDMTDEKELIDEKELSGEPWNYTWTVDKTDNEGNEYIYTVDEANVPENYKKEEIKETEEGFEITNTYVIPPIDITGTKEWINGPANKPAIELQLYRDGEPYEDPVTLDGEEETPWTYTWKELDETDLDGNPYTYTVDEVKVPARYRKSISEDGLTVINRYRPGGSGGTEPEDPEDPEEPTDPEEPKDPTEPEGPEEPEDPTGPEEPIEPEEPIVPEDPEDPEKPTETPKYEYPEVPDPDDPDSPDEFILIEKEGAPLGTYTKHQKDDGTFVYLDENKVPLGSEPAPKTGDKMPILLMIIIHILSLGTALYLIKHKNELYN